MDEILKTLAQHSGINPETAKAGLGAVFSWLKEHLPKEVFGKVEQSVPDAHALASSFEGAHGPGGITGAIAGIAGKVLGGDMADLSKLVAMLGKAGLNLDQVAKFLPRALELVREHIPADLLDKILKQIPDLAGARKP